MDASAAGPSSSSRWQFGQCFGEREGGDAEDFSEADILSAVEFDHSGDYLATGDKGGRIVLFERVDPGKGQKRPRAPRPPGEDEDMLAAPAEYRFYTEFQSHEEEFDYLKSMEIEEKINQIAWCQRTNGALHLLSTNDKTIKLWKIHERKLKAVTSMNVEAGRYGGRVPVTSLRIPRVTTSETQVIAMPRRVFGNVHAYHVNSISTNSDGQTFLSADDLRINLWSLDNARLSFNIVDIKPPTLEELTEVVTSACFHPIHSHTFLYSTSRGAIKLGDMREAALCDRNAKVFEEAEDAASKSYFSEIIASVSHITFSRCGRYLVSRDYLRLKVWDTAMEKEPLLVIPVHEYLRPRLTDLYESDCIFDKFEVGVSARTDTALTGSYGNSFRLYDFRLAAQGPPDSFGALAAAAAAAAAGGGPGPAGGSAAGGGAGAGHGGRPVVHPGAETMIELCKQARPNPPVVRPIPPCPPPGALDESASGMAVDGILGGEGGAGHEALRPPPGVDVGGLDFTRKVLHYSFHPVDDIVAVAGLNNLYIYYAN